MRGGHWADTRYMYSTKGQTYERTTKKVVLRWPCQLKNLQCFQTGHMKGNRVSKENKYYSIQYDYNW